MFTVVMGSEGPRSIVRRLQGPGQGYHFSGTALLLLRGALAEDYI